MLLRIPTRRFTQSLLLLSLSITLLWTQSLLTTDLLRFNLRATELSLFSSHGAIQIRLVTYRLGNSPPRVTLRSLPNKLAEIALAIEDFPIKFDSTPGPHWTLKSSYDEGEFDGFSPTIAPDFHSGLIVLPYWIPLALALIPLLIVIRKRRPAVTSPPTPPASAPSAGTNVHPSSKEQPLRLRQKLRPNTIPPHYSPLPARVMSLAPAQQGPA